MSIRAAYNSGIIDYSINGTKKYAEEGKKEESILSNTESFMKSILDKIGDSSTGNESGITINLSISGTTVNETNPPIPTGFYHVGSTTIADGYVISDVEGDDLANSQGGNQFVWVPVQKDQVISLSVTSGEDIESLVLYNPYGDKIIDLTNQGKSYSTTINTYGNMDCINGKYTAVVTTENEEESKILIVRSLYAQDTFQTYMSNDEIAQGLGFESYNDVIEFFSSAEGISSLYQGDMDTEAEVFAFLGEYIGQEITTREQFGQIYSQLMVDMIRNEDEEDNTWLKDYTDITEANGTRVLYSESVNNNGGFYIGRYETGNNSGTAVCKANQEPYNNISQTSALTEVQEINAACTLLTGAAWDRTLGFLTETGTNSKTVSQITNDSTTWGNYNNAGFPITNTSAKYSTNKGISYTGVSGSYTKPENNSVLLTTGAEKRNISKNIYDLAGNLEEWTSQSNGSDVIFRGGSYNGIGDDVPASNRNYDVASNTDVYVGFRPALFIR